MQQEAFVSATAMLEVLSRGPACSCAIPRLQRLVEPAEWRSGGIQGVYLANPQGTILCASTRSAVGLNIADKPIWRGRWRAGQRC